MTSQEQITRIRVVYTKGDDLRFTGHLDLQRLWERLLRRSRLPIRYSQGFHPRARLNLASALPLGFISEAELLDFWMNEPKPIAEIHHKLFDAAPPGLGIRSVKGVELSKDALQTQMHASEFEVQFFDPPTDELLREKAAALLAKDEIIRKRRKKIYDLRPLILEIKSIPLNEDQPGLWMRLLAEPSATGRPDEVLAEMDYQNTAYKVKRTRIILA